MTTAQRKKKAQERDVQESKKARRIINTIFVALILLMFMALFAYYALFGNS